MDRPRSCRVIYYFDSPALGIRHQLFDRVSSTQLLQEFGTFGNLLNNINKRNVEFHFLENLENPFFFVIFLEPRSFKGKGGIFLKLKFIKFGLTFGVMVVVSVCERKCCFFFMLSSISISYSFSISICFDLCSSYSFPLCSVIALTFYFGFNAWEDNFSLICASNFPTLKATCPICFSKL